MSTGILTHIQNRMAEFKARNLQGLPVYELSPEQYDVLADELKAAGASHDFGGRPALMVCGAKVVLK